MTAATEKFNRACAASYRVACTPAAYLETQWMEFQRETEEEDTGTTTWLPLHVARAIAAYFATYSASCGAVVTLCNCAEASYLLQPTQVVTCMALLSGKMCCVYIIYVHCKLKSLRRHCDGN